MAVPAFDNSAPWIQTVTTGEKKEIGMAVSDGMKVVVPTDGPIAEIFEGSGPYALRFLTSFESQFDQSEGWIVSEDRSLTWYFSRLALTATVTPIDVSGLRFSEFVEIDVVVTEGVSEIGTQLFVALNHLNSQSNGWVVWLDRDNQQIKISLRAPLYRVGYYWLTLVFNAIPSMLAVADAACETLSELAHGRVALRTHPDMGVRETHDSWIDGVRQGPIDMSCALGAPLTTLELASIRDFVGQMFPRSTVRADHPFLIELSNTDGVSYACSLETWSREYGYGWRLVSRPSADLAEQSDDEAWDSLEYVANANSLDMANPFPFARFGGWVADDFNEVFRQMFVESFTIEELLRDARWSFPLVMADVIVAHELWTDRGDELCQVIGELSESSESLQQVAHSLGESIGDISRRSSLPHSLQPFFGVWDQNDLQLFNQMNWLVPRSIPLVSWGSFNPAGPTVGSFELSHLGDEWFLWFILRHPHSPETKILRTFNDSDLRESLPVAIEEILASEEILGSGPEWVSLRSNWLRPSVIRGLSKFAEGYERDDLLKECQKLMVRAGDPWSCVEVEALVDDLRDIDDPLSLWLSLVTDEDYAFGHVLFLRSAWEGSKLYVSDGPERAMQLANTIIFNTRERVRADFDFRRREGRLIATPTHESLSLGIES
jgi:hypothetical protein